MAGPVTDPSPVTFEAYLKDRLDTKGLTIDNLKFHPCSESVLRKLSRSLDNWKLVGYSLELTRCDIQAIKDDNSSIEEKRVELLYKWKQKNGDDATYYNLIFGLHDAERIELADQALDCLKENIIEIKKQQEKVQQEQEKREKEERLEQEIQLEYEMKENFLTRMKTKVESKGLHVPDLQVNLRQEDVDSVAEQIGKDWYTFGKNMKVEESTLDHIKEVGGNKLGRKKKLLEHLIIKKVRFEDIIYGLYNSADEDDPSIDGILQYLSRIRIEQPKKSSDCIQDTRADKKQLDKSSRPDQRPRSYEKHISKSKPRDQKLTPPSSSASIQRQRIPVPQRTPVPWQAKFDERQKSPPTSSILRHHLNDLTPNNYQVHFYRALWLEEDEHIKKLSKKCDGVDYKFVVYDQDKVPRFLVQNHNRECLYGHLSGLTDDKIEYATQASDNVAISQPDSSACLCIAFKHRYNFSCLENRMYIVADNPSHSLFQAIKSGTKVDEGSEISVSAQFIVKYSYFDHLHHAVVKAPEYVLKCLLPDVFSFGDQFLTFDPRYSKCRFMELDKKHQVKALKMIVSESPSTGKPAPPVILYGPFGTGKTRILARAAYEVMMNGVSQKRCTRVLISAHHEMSIKTFIFAYFGKIYYLPFKIFLISRQKNRGVYAHMYMTPEYFAERSAEICSMSHVIIITTYTTSLKLHQYLCSPEGFFTHLFLDEAAQVREPEAITPLALATKDAKIVLAGDNKQVGPNILVLGKEARMFGLNISLLERLLMRYKKIGQVAASYVTKLSVNYRSHNSLIHLPNLFYENLELNTDKSLQKCSGPTGYSFVSADSRLIEQYDDPDQQWVEACIVLEEVRSYLERMKHINPKFNPRHDVCIITSTRKQLNRIKTMAFRYKEYEAVREVSFNPSFIIQGHEFQAIFLSLFELVEDDDEMNASYIKSLFNPYVFNTAITRAKFRVVAIGSPDEVKQFELDTLSHPDRGGNTTQCWHEYLELCTKLKTISNSKHRILPKFKRKKVEQKVILSNDGQDASLEKDTVAKTEMEDECKAGGELEQDNHQSDKPEASTRQLSLIERVEKLETEKNGRIKTLEEENALLKEELKQLKQELEDKRKHDRESTSSSISDRATSQRQNKDIPTPQHRTKSKKKK